MGTNGIKWNGKRYSDYRIKNVLLLLLLLLLFVVNVTVVVNVAVNVVFVTAVVTVSVAVVAVTVTNVVVAAVFFCVFFCCCCCCCCCCCYCCYWWWYVWFHTSQHVLFSYITVSIKEWQYALTSVDNIHHYNTLIDSYYKYVKLVCEWVFSGRWKIERTSTRVISCIL